MALQLFLMHQSLGSSQEICVPHDYPRTVRLFPKNGECVSSPDRCIATGKWNGPNRKQGPRVGEVSGHLDFLDLTGGFDLVLLKQSPEPLFKGGSSSHWRVAGNEKDDILRHELENGVHVSRSCSAVPEREHVSNCLLVLIQHDLYRCRGSSV